MQPICRFSMHSKCLDCFSFKFWVGEGEDFFHFPFVPNMFPMCSPKVFPIAPHFIRVCFAQSPPLLTYLGGPKGEALHLSQNLLFWGAFIVSTFFLQWANQIGSLQQQKKVALMRQPQLINMKHVIKYPRFVGCSLRGVLAQAKIGDQLFWEEKFHATNGKAQACTQGALLFILLSFVGKGFFFIFPLFPLCSL